MTINHTPGPWSVQHDGAGYPMIAGPEATDATTEARFHWIANVLPVPGLLHWHSQARETGRVMETEANARLIAAAPDMLAALKATTEALAQSYIEAAAADADPRVIAGRAAIAKAEGR